MVVRLSSILLLTMDGDLTPPCPLLQLPGHSKRKAMYRECTLQVKRPSAIIYSYFRACEEDPGTQAHLGSPSESLLKGVFTELLSVDVWRLVLARGASQ